MIVLGLGGNVGEDAAIVARFGAVADAFRSWGRVRASSVYRTAPIGPDQPPFLNAALDLRVDLEPLPEELWTTIVETERLLGRDRMREARWGPRTIDIDVLVWTGHDRRWAVGDSWLEIPHPRLTARRFALEPTAELLGDTTIVANRPLRAWLDDVHAQTVALTDLTIA